MYWLIDIEALKCCISSDCQQVSVNVDMKNSFLLQMESHEISQLVAHSFHVFIDLFLDNCQFLL